MDEQQSDNSSIKPMDCAPLDMPSIASLFQAACRELAQSDAKIYRSVGQHIARTKEILNQAEAVNNSPKLAESLSQIVVEMAPTYDRQTRKSLELVCKEHGITGYSRLSKSKMVALLQANEIPPPPVPMEALTKAELITFLRQAIYQSANNDH